MSDTHKNDWFLWVIATVLFILLFIYVKVSDSDIHGLQRRISILEQERRVESRK